VKVGREKRGRKRNGMDPGAILLPRKLDTTDGGRKSTTEPGLSNGKQSQRRDKFDSQGKKPA